MAAAASSLILLCALLALPIPAPGEQRTSAFTFLNALGEAGEGDRLQDKVAIE